MSPSARAARVSGSAPSAARHLALVAPGDAAPVPASVGPRALGAVALVLTLGTLSLVAVVTTVLAALPGPSLPAR